MSHNIEFYIPKSEIIPNGIVNIMPTPKTIISIGKKAAIVMSVDKRFNWFQKKMMEWCFGWKVEDVNND